MDEVGYINHSAVASALTYGTNRGVTTMMLCSPVDAGHWLSKMDEITNGDEKGVCLISLQYLCRTCAQKGKTGICIHGSLILPWHIDAGEDLEYDPVRQIMDRVSPGSYQQEICGYNDHTQSRETDVFSQSSLKRLTQENWIELSESDQKKVDCILVSLDPVQAGSSVSGIGFAAVAQIGQVYVVSRDPINVLPFRSEWKAGYRSINGVSGSGEVGEWGIFAGLTNMGLSIIVGNLTDSIVALTVFSNDSVCKPLALCAKLWSVLWKVMLSTS